MSKWTKEIPNEVGTYLFYGYTSDSLHYINNKQKPQILSIGVFLSANGILCFSTRGEFIYPYSTKSIEKCVGIWKRLHNYEIDLDLYNEALEEALDGHR